METKEIVKKIVIPGEVLAESMDLLPGHGTYREDKKIYSKFIGILRKNGSIISVIPLAGKYNPKIGDYVIGEIKEVGFSHWNVDINSPYSASIPMSEGTNDFIERNADLARYHDIGDLILTKVVAVTKNKYMNVSMKDPKCRKLIGGLVVEIAPSKVPRLIGKAGSMIQLIKDNTGCYITVGQNGRVWIKGEKEDKAAEAVKKVDELAHTNGLTDKIGKMLKVKKDEKKK